MFKFEIFKSMFMNGKFSEHYLNKASLYYILPVYYWNGKGNDLHNKVYFDIVIVGRLNCFDKIL